MFPGLPCLNTPGALHVFGRFLVIADTGNHVVRVLDLDSRILTTLVGDPSQAREARPGALRAFSPGSSPEACAAVPCPTALAVDADGQCLVESGAALFRFDLADAAALLPRSESKAPAGH